MENGTRPTWALVFKALTVTFAAQFLWIGLILLLGLLVPTTLSFDDLLTVTGLQLSWILGPVLSAPLLAHAIAGARVRSHGRTALGLFFAWVVFLLPLAGIALIQAESMFVMVTYSFVVYGTAWAVPIASAVLLGQVFFSPAAQSSSALLAIREQNMKGSRAKT